MVAGLMLMATLGAPPAEAVHLQGRVVHVGYPAAGQDDYGKGNDFYRHGRWVPVQVLLENRDGDLFTGQIEVRQRDRDGDVVLARRSVTVRDKERFFLYIPANLFSSDVLAGGLGSDDLFAVRVYDENGRLAPLYNDSEERIDVLHPARQLSSITEREALVMLDISAQPVNALNLLLSFDRLARPLVVARSSPSELPELAAGFDMADYVIWDGADPAQVRDPVQLWALMEWVHGGGILVLGVSRNWELVGKSMMSELLPARLGGVGTLNAVPAGWQGTLFGQSVTAPEKPLTYSRITLNSLRPDAHAIIPSRQVEPDDPLAVVGGPYGRGKVILAGMELRDLFGQATLDQQNVLREMLGLQVKRQNDETNIHHMYMGQQDLFERTLQMIGFQTTAGVFFLFAFLFVIAYILLATGGTWFWLLRRRQVHYSWVLFSFVAILASGVSLIAVQFIRGIGYRVQEMSVVDAQAGSYEAQATCYYGLKTPTHTQLDLRVPKDWTRVDDEVAAAGTLQALPADPTQVEASTYAVSQNYAAGALLGELYGVPLRATLKQFEATWQGQMTGRLVGQLKREGAYLSDTSWIGNELNTDLEQCYLLVPTSYYQPGMSGGANRILVYPLGTLPDKEKFQVGSLVRQYTLRMKEDKSGAGGAAGNLLSGNTGTERQWRPPFLSNVQARWLRDHVNVQDYYGKDEENLKLDTSRYTTAMLLLTVFDETDQDQLVQNEARVIRSGGQQLDRSHFLCAGRALFVGFSQDPGPTRLCWRTPGKDDWRPITPDSAKVMYRISMPIE